MIDFSEKEIQLILESLLYAASPDVNLRIYKEDMDDIENLALKIRHKFPTVFTKNTFVLNDLRFCSLQKQLKENFPELSIN